MTEVLQSGPAKAPLMDSDPFWPREGPPPALLFGRGRGGAFSNQGFMQITNGSFTPEWHRQLAWAAQVHLLFETACMLNTDCPSTYFVFVVSGVLGNFESDG